MLNAARRGAVRFVNEATRHHRREFRSGAVLLSIVAVYARPLPTQRLSDWGSETSTWGGGVWRSTAQVAKELQIIRQAVSSTANGAPK